MTQPDQIMRYELPECGKCSCTAGCMKENAKDIPQGISFVPESALTTANERIAELEADLKEQRAYVKELRQKGFELIDLRASLRALNDHAEKYLPELANAVHRDDHRQRNDFNNHRAEGGNAFNAIKSVFVELRALEGKE